MRIIDADALKKSMRKSINERYISWTKTITVADIATLIFDEIEYAPTVDTTCPNCGAKMMKETDTCENTKHGTCEWYTSDIRWTDKLSVIANGDIIDFNGRVVGHMNLEIMKGGAE